ncbi:endonuclease V [Sphingomonas oleivorans]|uniref:Endonuclease V n=1 Tax=Sphingomonas oleivorans TaxID=1735121 RepID=A0A2T5FYL4_9SPHN|nr:endonuclease V [Sphingomonas oleivorans]PTQ11629.1 endonuclease V [Sphingomonas oleivorans]
MNDRHNLHWLEPPSLAAATKIQHEIAAACETKDRLGVVGRIAGADVSMKWRDSRGPIHAAVAPILWPERRIEPAATATRIPRFPYVPGYLGFREAPAVLAAWEGLVDKPDLLLVDGQGRSHPRRCGVATQIGVLLDMPTIGIAKSLLCGSIEGEVGPRAGDRAPVVHRGEEVAIALRTSPRGGPIFVSIGHRLSLETAVDWALRLSEGRRLPLPIRLAHDAANAARRAAASSSLPSEG